MGPDISTVIAEPLLEARGISYSVGDARLLDEVGIRLDAGGLLGLIGPNGAGKSTLVRIIAGLLRPSAGEVRLAGAPLHGMDPQVRARSLGYLPQGAEVHWPLQVERLVGLGRLPHLAPWQSPGEGDRQVVERVMGQTDILHLRERTFDTLSGGERARVLMARVLAVEPRVLLADEPAAALDPRHQVQVMALLRGHCERGGSAVVVLHDLALAVRFCHRLVLLHRGRVLAEGAPDEVLAGPAVAAAYGLRLKARADGSVALPEFPWALAE